MHYDWLDRGRSGDISTNEDTFRSLTNQHLPLANQIQ